MSGLCNTRIKSIKFVNFRNIELGSIDFPNSKFNDFIFEESPSILGLYGQNGSGKTSVIMAIELLKDVISGKILENKYLSCIKKGTSRCTLEYTFSLFSEPDEPVSEIDNVECYEVYYSFELASYLKTRDERLLYAENDELEEYLRIENEKFKYRILKPSGEMISQKQTYIDTSMENGKNVFFGSEGKLKESIGNNNEISQKLLSFKYITYERSQSYVFCSDVFDLIGEGYTRSHNKELAQKYDELIGSLKTRMAEKKNSKGKKAHKPLSETERTILNNYHEYSENLLPLELITSLFLFGRLYLHVINTSMNGIININSELPLLLWNNEKMIPYKKITVQMNTKSRVPEEDYDSISNSLSCLNLVLESIIPGMKLKPANKQVVSSENNKNECLFDIMSCKDDSIIPLKYESDGIRRIISILSLLIAAYNEPSFTIAIDEFDSGIYEYLLGEILSVFSDSSKGQLIFTSHNLRPLEVLPAKFLCFTTTNPNNRFIKIANRGNSNLRDGYFRSIILDTQKEQVYKPTNKYEIQTAFYEAGHGADHHG